MMNAQEQDTEGTLARRLVAAGWEKLLQFFFTNM